MSSQRETPGRLTPAQIDHFDSFGFLVLPKAFSAEEMGRIIAAADDQWSRILAEDPNAVHPSPFVEERPDLLNLVTDDRIYQPMVQLLGRDFIWSGSEGHLQEPHPEVDWHHWHSDRAGALEIDYRRIKIMLYLEPKTKAEGALRVIPGSHRDPLHTELLPFHISHTQAGARFFDLPGQEIPCHALETQPGDVAMFSQSLFHAVYGKCERRRYVALKFAAARPRTHTWPRCSGGRPPSIHTRYSWKQMTPVSPGWSRDWWSLATARTSWCRNFIRKPD